jgi:hypothetical protein
MATTPGLSKKQLPFILGAVLWASGALAADLQVPDQRGLIEDWALQLTTCDCDLAEPAITCDCDLATVIVTCDCDLATSPPPRQIIIRSRY